MKCFNLSLWNVPPLRSGYFTWLATLPISAGLSAVLMSNDLHLPAIEVESVAVKKLARQSGDSDALAVVALSSQQPLPKQFVIELEGKKRILRDDGQDGDTAANDQKYTVLIPFAEENLLRQQAAAQRQAKVQEASSRTAWVGREKVISDDATTFHLQDFIAGEMQSLKRFSLATPLEIWDRSLMIRSTPITDDPRASGMGPWSFGYAMTRLAEKNGRDPSEFVREWLRLWEVPQGINGDTAAARPNVVASIVNQWPKIATGPNTGQLDLSQSPFRLLAIVHRIDLRNDPLVGGKAGENRLVYCLTDLAGNPQQFTVIFEYGILGQPKPEAQAWLNLSQWDVSTNEYKTALEALTEKFVNDPSNTYSQLDQLRTNELAIGSPWQLREFKISAGPDDKGLLRQTTVKQTPPSNMNQTGTAKNELISWVNANAADILAGTAILPSATLGGQPLLGGSSEASLNEAWLVNSGVSSSRARHLFALNTCIGCHSNETATEFTHIKPRAAGSIAGLSEFMEGKDVPDPGAPGLSHPFGERTRRVEDLEAIALLPDIFQLVYLPIRSTH